MNHYRLNFNPSRIHNRSKELRADMRNRKFDGGWRKTLKRLNELSPKDLEALMNVVMAYKNKPTTRDKGLMIGAAAILALAAFGVYHFSKQNQPKPDTYKPKISNLRYNPKVTLDEKGYATQNVNFTATDYIDSKNNTGPTSVKVKLTYDSGESVNGTIEKLDGNFFRSRFNVTEEGQPKIEVKVEDLAGNVARLQGEFEVVKKPQPPPVEPSFVEHFVGKGYNKTILEDLSSELPRLEEVMFPKIDLRDYLEEIVKYANNNGTSPIKRNAVGIIANSVYNNPDVKNPEMLRYR